MLVDQAPERFLVSVPQGVEQLGVVHAGSVERSARRAESLGETPHPRMPRQLLESRPTTAIVPARRYIAIVV